MTRKNMRDSSDWHSTAYRTHTIGQVVSGGSKILGKEVSIAGYAETVRGRGAICFLMLRDGTGNIQAFLKKIIWRHPYLILSNLQHGNQQLK